MSVPKSRRGESPADYLDLAREIYVFTYDRVKILPKSHTFYFSLPLYNAAQRAYRLVKTANLVYIDEKAPDEIRRRTIQRRRELYEDAQGYYNSMLAVSRFAVNWWLRSPNRSNSTNFVNVNTDGTVNNANANNSLAFAPGFRTGQTE